MALAKRDKEAIIQGVGAIGLVAFPAVVGLTAQFNRVRFPQLQPRFISQSLRDAEALRQRGVDPFITTDPFLGDLVVAGADQNVPQLLAERALRELSRPSAEAIRELGDLRTELIELQSSTAVERGFFPTTQSLPQFSSNLADRPRCGVFRETAQSPAQFRCF